MRLPDFEAWAVFAAIAEQGGISAAAAALGTTKATISKALARLEAAQGTVLFHRTSRRLTLSASGAALLDHARRIVAEGVAAEEAASNEASEPSGCIRLAAPMSFGLRALAEPLARFMAEYPKITLDVHLSDSKVDLIDDGFDLALRIAALPDSSLRAIRIRGVERQLVAAPAYLDAHGRPQHPDDLAHHAGFLYANSNLPELWQLVRGDGARARVRPRAVMQCNNSDFVLPALIAGQGIALMPDFMCADALSQGTLEAVLGDWNFEEIALNIVMPPSPHRPARVSALVAFLRRELA
ncbi:MAG: LysR family transcriptional regulator [Blastomonas sp.]